MTNDNLNILLKHAKRERDSIRGHARELNAAADTQDALIAALEEMQAENQQLKSKNQELQNKNVTINNNFNAPIGYNIQQLDNLYPQS